jgi:hypothetical protein
LQSFSDAAAETFGSSTSSKSKQSRSASSDRRTARSGKSREPENGEEEDITSPLKSVEDVVKNKMKNKMEERRPVSAKSLFQEDPMGKSAPAFHKRKSDGKECAAPNLNVSATENALVPAGLVNVRITQLGMLLTKLWMKWRHRRR